MPYWLPAALIGLLFGLVISGVNYYILAQGIKKAEQDPSKNTLVIASRYGIRYVINMAALFLVYKNTPMLIATAFGLTFNKYVFLVKRWVPVVLLGTTILILPIL